MHVFRQARRLDHWCHKHDVHEAVVGGFYLRDPFRPLGDVWCAGEHAEGTPFLPATAASARRCTRTTGGWRSRRAARSPQRPEGDLLQAGPLLVADGEIAFDGTDREGFTAGAAQFDSDITDGRHPRAAIGIAEKHLVVLVCDGRRSRIDAGLSMVELAGLMRDLGCRVAMNLDGGGSTTLVHRGHLLNRPYSEQDQAAPASRPIVSALLFSA